MKSWDLFDTLIAAPDPHTRCGEQSRYFPIAENVARVERGDMIISDYHTPIKAWDILRNDAQLHNDLHVSEDDKATGKIWDRLQHDGNCPSLHIGGEPVYWQDGIDWTANPHINVMHDAFDVCVAAMDNYPFPHIGNSQELLAKMLAKHNADQGALSPLTEFRREEAIRAAELLKGVEGVVV